MKHRQRFRSSVAAALLATDAITTLGAFLAAYWLRYSPPVVHRIPITGDVVPPFAIYVVGGLVITLVWLATFALAGLYRPRRGQSAVDEFYAVFGAVSLGTMIVMSVSFFVRGVSFSRLVLVLAWVSALVCINLGRLVIRSVQASLRRRGVGVDRTLVVGSGSAAQLLIQRVAMHPHYGYQVVAVLADGDGLSGSAQPTVLGGAPVVGTAGDLSTVLSEREIDTVFFSLPNTPHDRLLRLIDEAAAAEVEVKIVPDLLEIVTSRIDADEIDGIPLVQLRQVSIRGFNLVLKRMLDVVVAASVLAVAGPLLMAPIALLIRRTSPGAPAVLRQERVGIDGRPFNMLKFRTMRPDAEAETGPVFAQRADPRMTAVGRLLRRYSLDELPQFLNVLRGEMSVVGPRPERPYFVEQFTASIPRYMDRHSVKAGITGWAQVNDLRGNTSIEDRTGFDLYYVENWSLGFDLKIMLMTLGRVFRHQHAY